MDAAPVPALRLFGRLGAEASGRLWPWRLPDIGRDRLGQQVRARLRGLAVLREGSGEAPSPAWGLDRRIRCPSLPVRPGAGTTGPRLN